MKKFESTVHVQRFVLGIVCGLLPILCTLFGVWFASCGLESWLCFDSISRTYHTYFCIIMIGCLWLCSFFLLCYRGYDLGDRIYTIIAGVGAFGVAAFPMQYNGNLGLFPFISPEVNGILHIISALMVFGSFGLMTLFQFTKGQNKKRNIIYRVCGIGILIALLLLGISSFIPYIPYSTMVLEFFMLEFFAVAWITKSKII